MKAWWPKGVQMGCVSSCVVHPQVHTQSLYVLMRSNWLVCQTTCLSKMLQLCHWWHWRHGRYFDELFALAHLTQHDLFCLLMVAATYGYIQPCRWFPASTPASDVKSAHGCWQSHRCCAALCPSCCIGRSHLRNEALARSCKPNHLSYNLFSVSPSYIESIHRADISWT